MRTAHNASTAVPMNAPRPKTPRHRNSEPRKLKNGMDKEHTRAPGPKATQATGVTRADAVTKASQKCVRRSPDSWAMMVAPEQFSPFLSWGKTQGAARFCAVPFERVRLL